jgi:hypothetical protein
MCSLLWAQLQVIRNLARRQPPVCNTLEGVYGCRLISNRELLLIQIYVGNTKKQIPFLSKSNTNRSSQHFLDGPVNDSCHSPGPQTPKASRQRKTDSMVVASSNLEKKVDDLTAKIAELTALIMTQQGTSPEET